MHCREIRYELLLVQKNRIAEHLASRDNEDAVATTSVLSGREEPVVTVNNDHDESKSNEIQPMAIEVLEDEHEQLAPSSVVPTSELFRSAQLEDDELKPIIAYLKNKVLPDD